MKKKPAYQGRLFCLGGQVYSFSVTGTPAAAEQI
jgi:hypothetical protein